MVREFHGGDKMTKKPKRSKKATKSSKRTKVAAKPATKTKVGTKSASAVTQSATPATESTVTPVTRSQAARAHIAEGTRLFALAGRPTKAQFVKVYGPKGPKITWAQRAKAGVDAKHF
jgi:hypothetical protein